MKIDPLVWNLMRNILSDCRNVTEYDLYKRLTGMLRVEVASHITAIEFSIARTLTFSINYEK